MSLETNLGVSQFPFLSWCWFLPRAVLPELRQSWLPSSPGFLGPMQRAFLLHVPVLPWGSFPLLSQSSQWQWNNLITGWSCQETWEIWHRKTSGNFQTYSVWEFFLGKNLKKSFVAKLLWTFFFLEFWLFCEIILVTLWNNSLINYSEEKIHLGNWYNVMIVCVFQEHRVGKYTNLGHERTDFTKVTPGHISQKGIVTAEQERRTQAEW